MASFRFSRWCTIGLAAAVLLAGAGQIACEPPKPAPPDKPHDLNAPRPVKEAELPPPPPSILDPNAAPIDLPSALRLAGVQNAQILLARERVTEAVAEHQLAAAQILPSLNAGLDVDTHTGPLQRAVGAIQKVNRGSMYLGLGANAVGAGTVNIPGLVWSGNVSETIYGQLITRQVVREREFAGTAVANDMLLQTAEAYVTLLQAEGRRAIAVQARDDSHEVARITANFAAAGQGRQADADRAATDLQEREAEIIEAENAELTASARLCELLNLDPSVRLTATDGWVVPAPVVPDPIPLPELIAIALTRRPELAERQAAIREAILALNAAKVLPFSPNLIVGYSAGTFGGGSNLAAEGAAGAPPQSRFDNFGPRTDFDAVVYWTARNLGVGNLATIRLAQSNVRTNSLRQLEVLDRVRSEVATAYARTHARFAQIETSERAVQSGKQAFQEDLVRAKNNEAHPIEVLDSLRLLRTGRYDLLDAISAYNRAQFELYVALGQPPADVLARPIPADLVPPPPAPIPCAGGGAASMNDEQLDLEHGGTRWRRLAWAAARLLPIFAGALGCQSAGGERRIRIPILTGPDIAAPMLRAVTVRERGEDRSLTVAARRDVAPGREEAPVIPPPVAVDCIDLATALAQAGVENPTIGLAEEAVRASLAEQLQARALLLPSLDAGVSYNLHRGRLQNAQGAILDVNRQSLYGGAGAAAVGAGTVGFPGVHLYADLGDAVFEPRVVRERVAAVSFDAAATQNAVLLDVTGRYLALVEAEARVQAIRQSDAEFKQVADMTADFARTGQGRQADADRAKADALLLHAAEQQAEEDEAVASAELARMLSRDPGVRLRTPGGPVPMVPLVDPRLDLESLVRIALDSRPEVAARGADVALNEARLREERFRPLLPVLSVGYSAGQFGGGSDTTDPRFGSFGGRTDFDAYAFWSLENLGVGNWARQRRRRAEVGEAQSERVRTIDRIRRETADAYAASAARLREVDTAGRRLATAQRAFEEDLRRARNLEAWPIEVLNSLSLLNAARQDLIRALVGYDEAQFQLFVALGRPPTTASYTETKCPPPTSGTQDNKGCNSVR